MANERVGNFWLWISITLFVAIEWVLIFRPSFRTSFTFFYQLPRDFSCSQLSKADSELGFFNWKMWAIFCLSQAIVWGAVFYISTRRIIDLWGTGERTGRSWRVFKVIFRLLAFGFGLWFFLTPTHAWDLGGCFSEHVTVAGAPALGYIAVGSSVLAMWILGNRVSTLDVESGCLIVARQYLVFRKHLQSLLSMSSMILVFGVIGLLTRKSFFESVSRQRLFYPHSILLEGFEYTLLLALAYAPVHAAFNLIGIKIRNALIPNSAKEDGSDFQQWWRFSQDLDDLLQIKIDDWRTLGPSFSILAPFLLGLVSTLVKKG